MAVAVAGKPKDNRHNLGQYAIAGGPGRPRGSVDRAKALMDAITAKGRALAQDPNLDVNTAIQTWLMSRPDDELYQGFMRLLPRNVEVDAGGSFGMVLDVVAAKLLEHQQAQRLSVDLVDVEALPIHDSKELGKPAAIDPEEAVLPRVDDAQGQAGGDGGGQADVDG